MSPRLISTGSPFEKTAGYSRAVIDGDFAFIAGTTGYDHKTHTLPAHGGSPAPTGYDYKPMPMPADVASQARNCFKTIETTLNDGGFAMADIVRATYYVTDASHADHVLAVCGETVAG